MPKQRPMPKDQNQLAARIVAMTTGQVSRQLDEKSRVVNTIFSVKDCY